MNREMLQQLLAKAKPGWRIKVDPNLSVATGNTHPNMVQYKGKLLSITYINRYYVYVKEDNEDFSWDYHHIVGVIPPILLKRRPS
jgi:hypothetical protein